MTLTRLADTARHAATTIPGVYGFLRLRKVVHLDSFGGAELSHMSITEGGRAGRVRTSEDITMWACRDIRSSTHIKDERRMMLGENTLLTRAVSAIRPSRWR